MRLRAFLLWLVLFCSGIAIAGEADLSKYRLRVDGLGPIEIGMTPDAASAKLGVQLISLDIPDEGDGVCQYFYPDGKYDDIGFMVEDGRITRIDVYSKTVPTSDGIRVGDSETSVRKHFPGHVKESMHPYIGKEGKYLTVEPKPGFAFIFETENGSITTFRSGKPDSVRYIEGCL